MRPSSPLIIGSRGSPLALWQSQHVAELVQRIYPGLDVHIRVINTQGDRDLHTPLPLVGGKGLFTVEIEHALLAGDIHLAVHSLKDMPTDTTAGLVIAAVPMRASAADVLVSRHGYTWQSIPKGARIGSSSTRRKAQLLNYHKDVHVQDIRGNIDSRIAKAMADTSPYDAIILAEAGLARLGMLSNHTHVIDVQHMLPAPGQGALAIQTIDSLSMHTLLAPLNHRPTLFAVTAERTILHELGGGCSAPVAAYATMNATGDQMQVSVWVGSADGVRALRTQHTIACATLEQVIAQARIVAQSLIHQGARHFLHRTAE
jgi:hydroxymethylbilane synthase